MLLALFSLSLLLSRPSLSQSPQFLFSCCPISGPPPFLFGERASLCFAPAHQRAVSLLLKPSPLATTPPGAATYWLQGLLPCPVHFNLAFSTSRTPISHLPFLSIFSGPSSIVLDSARFPFCLSDFLPFSSLPLSDHPPSPHSFASVCVLRAPYLNCQSPSQVHPFWRAATTIQTNLVPCSPCRLRFSGSPPFSQSLLSFSSFVSICRAGSRVRLLRLPSPIHRNTERLLYVAPPIVHCLFTTRPRNLERSPFSFCRDPRTESYPTTTS